MEQNAPPMFIAALFTTAKIWKQLMWPTDEWKKKMWHISKQKNITQPQRSNEILPFKTMWMGLYRVLCLSQTKINYY